MKFTNQISSRDRRSRTGRHERGSAVVVSLILTSILIIFVASNVRNLRQLQREIREIDRRQERRLQTGGTTNQPPPAARP